MNSVESTESIEFAIFVKRVLEPDKIPACSHSACQEGRSNGEDPDPDPCFND